MKARLRVWTIFLAFLFTGVATALLGASLPSMLREWHLSDRAGGLLLFSSFTGATIGVLFASLGPSLMAGLGMGATACAALLLSASTQPILPLCFLLYGTGLGTTMTSISVLRSREVPRHETTLELNRLNLIWATGACLAPALALRSLRTVSVHALFGGVMFAFAFSAVALLIVNQWTPKATESGALFEVPRLQRLAPLRMCVFAGAAVGLETAIGSWLTAYTQRMGHGNAIAVTANSAFWLGLLLGRGAHSVRLGQRLNGPVGVGLHLGGGHARDGAPGRGTHGGAAAGLRPARWPGAGAAVSAGALVGAPPLPLQRGVHPGGHGGLAAALDHRRPLHQPSVPPSRSASPPAWPSWS